jgi:23S rRNA pseudouridine1911/1915/1917 synthase
MILQGTVGPEQAGMRLDDGARALFPELSKTRIRKIIDWGGCAIDHVMVRVASRALREGEVIALGLLEPERCIEFVLTTEDLLYEDPEYLAVCKPVGINSQRTSYQLKGTMEYAVEVYFRSHDVREPVRVIHRLDKGTSGVMFFPKAKRAATHISHLLKHGGVEKVYWALVAGSPDEDSWTVDASMAKLSKFRYGVAHPGKEARTIFRVLTRGEGVTLVEARPLTGRTHQIRVHLLYSGLPIIGDTVYGGEHAARMMLHCRSMSFPSRDRRPVSASAPLDADFLAICRSFGMTPEP